MKENPMYPSNYPSASHLSEESRVTVAPELNACLSDGIDLLTQTKVAHWNVRGPHFAALHPFFDDVAGRLSAQNDDLAERAVMLGARVWGSARHVAKTSRLPDWTHETSRDLDVVKALLERFEVHLYGLRGARRTAEKHGDTETVDLITGFLQTLEKDAWFLSAMLHT